MLLRDLGFQEIADEALRFVLALERRDQRLVVGASHPVELEAAHHVEDFGSLHRLGAPELIVSGAVGERLRKSGFRARRIISADSPYARAYRRVAGGKTGRSAEPLRNFSSRLPAVS